ncbi:MAG: thioredoxin family protein [Burkholderiales bacterium]|nr:thioredoxin family protein [Opitutaceae bacterium]
MNTKLQVGLLLGWGSLLAAWPPGGRATEASEATPDAPVEIGRVAWLRDLDDGLARAKAAGKPVFLLFQEVPGCAGCQEFGRDVLADARMVAAIETHFVPVFIPNNQPGKAAEVLKRYGEPAWNFQVVRFLAADGNDLIPRQDKIWTVPALAERMVRSLEKAGLPASEALQLLAGRR